MRTAIQTAQQKAPIPISALEDVTQAARDYVQVSVSGRYLATHQLLWDNRTHKGQAGFEVITPVVLDTGAVALVNRGWLPWGLSRANLPDVSLSGEATATPVQLNGFFTQPSRGFASGDALSGSADWPQLLQYFDYDAIGRALGEPIVAGVVQLQELGQPNTQPRFQPNLQPDLFAANWQPAAAGPAKHYGYAFQWFAMALALTIVFFVVNSKKITSRHE